MPPVVAAGLHRHRLSRPPHDHHVLDRPRARQRAVHVGLERHHASAAVAAVRGHDDLRLRVVHAVAERLRAEAAEHHAVGGADARAGQHGHGRFGDHGHVDAHAVALAHAEPLERAGEPAHHREQLSVCELADLARLPFPDQGRPVLSSPGHVPVQAVLRDVEGAPREPPGPGSLPFQHAVPLARPEQRLRLLRPEAFRVLQAPLVEGAVLGHGADVRLAGEGLGGREDPRFLQDGLDVSHA